MSSYNHILYDVQDNIATITLNREAQMNTMSVPVMHEMLHALDGVDADDDVRVVLFTGAGQRAFCAGADLSAGDKTFDYDRQDPSDRDLPKLNGVYRDWGGMLTLRLFDCLKPTIAVVNGASAGIGATMQTAMDIRLAVDSVKYVFPFTRRGIVPDAASSWFLTQVVGLPTALEWSLTGRRILADEALGRGLVRSLHAPKDLMPAALEIARDIADNTAPVSVALTRQMLWRYATAEHPMPVHAADSAILQGRGASADAHEGVMSFLEKRAPKFPDKVSDGLPACFPAWDPKDSF
ncbi:MAG: enoyl-CoA hydratase-related protein [Rhodobacteraceae bacterium]|nr:enoyl-CoA hydratase-related protein [Paracoccaceae bacterium]